MTALSEFGSADLIRRLPRFPSEKGACSGICMSKPRGGKTGGPGGRELMQNSYGGRWGTMRGRFADFRPRATQSEDVVHFPFPRPPDPLCFFRGENSWNSSAEGERTRFRWRLKHGPRRIGIERNPRPSFRKGPFAGNITRGN